MAFAFDDMLFVPVECYVKPRKEFVTICYYCINGSFYFVFKMVVVVKVDP